MDAIMFDTRYIVSISEIDIEKFDLVDRSRTA